MCSMNCLFLFICLLIFGDLTKVILSLSVCVALWDFYYILMFFQDMEDDFNRLVDVRGAVLIRSNLWFSFSLLYDRVRIKCILKISVAILRKFIEL